MPAGSAGSVPAPAETRSSSWGDLRVRVLSALVLAPLALAGIWFGAAFWMALVLLAALGLTAEWLALCAQPAPSPPALAVFFAVAAATLLTGAGLAQAGLAVLGGGAAVAAIVATPPGNAEPVWRRAALLAFGTFYIGLASVALVWLRDDAGTGPGGGAGTAAGRDNILFLVLVIWASDIGAYLAGRLIGGPKLAPAISPGKTWSGAAGGLVAAIAAGIAVADTAGAATALHAGLIAAGLGLVAQGGDLLESFLKRQFRVKDSSRLIPGHGGLFDRLDGVLTAAPAAAVLALSLGRGVLLWT